MNNEKEALPFSLVERIVAGENCVKLFREYRGLTREQLSQQSGIDELTIATLERSSHQAETSQLRAIADALNVDVERLT